MADRDILLARAASIHRCLQRIDSVRVPRPDLSVLDREDIRAVNLQRAVQCALDMAKHVASADRLGLPDGEQRPLELLATHGRISPELAGRPRRLGGFGDFSVHEYASLDPAIVESITRDHLGDLTTLASALLAEA
jgi:uncharacterized protein YutE (UPF0331/DUF86 family)